jgi:hypothetical protein
MGEGAYVFLRKMAMQFGEYLNGDNLTDVILEVGFWWGEYVSIVSNSSALLSHYKRFAISTKGAIVLVKELTRYQELFRGFDSPELEEKFDLLCQIGTLFLVKLENVKIAVTEGLLGKENPRVLLQYLRMREDWVDMKGMERDITADGSVNALNQMSFSIGFLSRN